MAQLNCQLCGGKMKKTVQSSGNCLGIAIALTNLTEAANRAADLQRFG